MFIVFLTSKLLPWVVVVQLLRHVNSLQPHELQRIRFPCPSTSHRVCLNSYPLIRWCHPTISSSVIPFSSCLQSFPASGYFPVSQCFTSGGQRIGASASASVLPVSTQGWFPLGFTALVSLLSKGPQESQGCIGSFICFTVLLRNVFCVITFPSWETSKVR